MRSAIDGAAVNAGSSWITRRGFLASMATLVAAPRVFGQGGSRPTIRTLRINSCGIAVTDVARSVEWYQSLFGMPIQAMQGETAILRLGEGPRYLAISPRGDEPPGFTSLGLAVENYDPERLAATLNAAGAQAEVRRRGPEQGGAPEGTPEVFFTDPLGGPVYLEHADNGGGSGVHGEILRTVPPSTERAPMPALTYSHMSGRVGPRAFYEQVFGLPVQAQQGPNVILLAVGPGPDFLTVGSSRPVTRSGGHFCLTMEGFDPSRVMGILADHGVTPVERRAGVEPQPLTAWTRLRQVANNGGGPTYPLGSWEFYIQDPDNIGLQIQDVTYCGGSGFNGQICP